MDAAPPSYSQGGPAQIPLPCPPVLINLAPATSVESDSATSDSEATTFQVGNLGQDRAYVAGEVQLKFTRGPQEPDVQYDRLEIGFRGIETVGNVAGAAVGSSSSEQHITLVDRHLTLWQAGRTARDDGTPHGMEQPPASTPFRFELTPDLPTCIHLGHSSLSYTLTATLHPAANSTAAPVTRSVPVHLVRIAAPAALVPARPATVTASDPISWRVRFPRTTFTRREPIGLVVRVEVPDLKRIGQGLRLRTVSAELVRTISVAVLTSTSTTDSSAPSTTGPAVEESRRTVLAHSGKSARFSPSRPIIIRLVLHPPLEPTCESISQSTILHNVSFAVIVTIGLVKTGSDSASSTSTSTAPAGPLPCDSILSQEITIVPDLPAKSGPLRSDKQKEVERAAESALASSSSPVSGHTTAGVSHHWDEEHPDAPVPSYVENSLLDPGTAGTPLATSSSPTASTSATWPSRSSALPSPSLHAGPPEGILSGYALTSSLGEGDDEALDAEDEYDGYEELSLPASLSDRPPPPRIDDDISPPSAGEPSSAVGFRLASVSGGVIDEDDEQGDFESGAPVAIASAQGALPSGAPPAFPPAAEARRTSLGEPETPPPPVEYSLPFLSTPAPTDSALYDPAQTRDLASTLPTGSIPSYSGPASGVPASPPPPLSPLTHEHPPLPPFSSPTASQQHERSPRGQPSRQARAGSDSLPPPYAGRENIARSPPALRALPLPEMQSSTGAQSLAARSPPRGVIVLGSPPPAFATSLAGETTRPALEGAAPTALRILEESTTTDSQSAAPPSGEGDDETRPPPYEQRDDGPSGPSGIEWGMMSNRRGELVL